MATESVAVGVGSGRCRGEGRPSKRWWAKPPTFWKGIRGFLLIRGGSLCCLMFCRLATEVWVPVSCRLPSGASLGPQHDSYLLAHGVGRRGARTAKLIYSATEPGPQKTGPLKPHLRRSSDRTGPTLRSLADIRQKVSNPLRRCLHFDVPRAPKTHHLFIPARKSTPGSGKADSTLCQITPSSTNLKTPCAKTASGRTRL